jgi:hypothetical protein
MGVGNWYESQIISEAHLCEMQSCTPSWGCPHSV